MVVAVAAEPCGGPFTEVLPCSPRFSKDGCSRLLSPLLPAGHSLGAHLDSWCWPCLSGRRRMARLPHHAAGPGPAQSPADLGSRERSPAAPVVRGAGAALELRPPGLSLCTPWDQGSGVQKRFQVEGRRSSQGGGPEPRPSRLSLGLLCARQRGSTSESLGSEELAQLRPSRFMNEETESQGGK